MPAAARLARILTPLAALVAGCTSGAMPRHADIARPGHLTAEAMLPIHHAPGTARGTADANGTPAEVEGSSGAHFNLWPGLMALPVWWELNGRIGVLHPCEAGPLLSLFRQGAEVRCGLAQQPDGAPLSVALSTAGAWQPFFESSLWWRAGLDLSRKLGGLYLTLGGYIERGAWVHHIRDVPERYAGLAADHVSPTARATLAGWRLSVPVGVAGDIGEPGSPTFGVVPWLALDQSPESLDCLGCALALEDFAVPWGISFVLGFQFATEEPLF